MTQPLLPDLLRIMVKERASDLILKTHGCPAMRIAGSIRFLGDLPLDHATMESYLTQVLDKRGMDEFLKLGATDRAINVSETGRFRCNAFHQSGELGFVFRSIKAEIPSFKDLNLPVEPLKRLAGLRRGLVLATGIAGSGKSTTLASMLEYVNRNQQKHIITIEDPIEFQFEDKRSIVNQREIGTDAPSFAEALRHAVRQSPDVILIGEMRDLETISMAITAAETGHLVFGTLHTTSALSTVDRIIDVFPHEAQQQVRVQLATTLQGVISQTLVPKTGGGRVAAREILIASDGVRSLIREGKTPQIVNLMQTGGKFGMTTLEMELASLVQKGLVSLDDALSRANRPDEVQKLAAAGGMRQAPAGAAGMAGSGMAARPTLGR